MNVETEVCSFDLAIKLRDLSVPQDSRFCYFNDTVGKYNIYNSSLFPDYLKYEVEKIAAFNVAELFEMLPAFIDIKENNPFNFFQLEVQKKTALNIQYIASYICDTIKGEEIQNPLFRVQSYIKAHDEKLADCLAKILIQLIEKKLIDLEALS